MTTSDGMMQVGCCNNNDTSVSMGFVVFNSSLVVEIAGDGTIGVVYRYRRYLT